MEIKTLINKKLKKLKKNLEPNIFCNFCNFFYSFGAWSHD